MTDSNVPCRANGATEDVDLVQTDVRLVYAVCASKGHDNEVHYECNKRMTSILEALEANNLTAASLPDQVGRSPRAMHILTCDLTVRIRKKNRT